MLIRDGMFLWILAGLWGCSSPSIQGTLTDGLTGSPLPEVRIVAKATSPDASLTCQAFEGTTGPDGAFTIDGVCSGTGYALRIKDDTLWVPEGTEVPDGGVEGLAIVAWRNAPGEGLYKLSAEGFDPLRSHADVKTDTILNSEEKVRYPWPKVPGTVPLIEKDAWLVMVGPKTVDSFEILPLIRSGPRKFGDKGTWVEMEPWYYIGIRFEDDETFERVQAQVDEAKVVVKKAGERAGKYIPGSAVAQGRYVVLGPDSRVLTIVDFQETWKPPEEQ